MSVFINFEIDGVNELKNMFENLTDEVKKEALEPALKEIIDEIADKAKANLRANIAKTKDSKSAGELEKHIKSVKSPKDSKGDIVARAVVVFRGRRMSTAKYLENVGLVKNFGKKYAKIGKSGKRIRVYAYYAHFVEYGTKKMKPRPFIRPAVQAVASKIPEIIQKHINKITAKYS
ncbi:HK97-gp10 family putative phage morphogenesis protein [Campylobacter sp.]|uniref:HK97-gp10 family putative phage morphogenesis protein n=1 Tax=Campylobacter sp. TaxID=205 RepID=UPI002A82DF60|nr:HK97-gp10 family putative phage morphogenesis protein [Campylobacter sp.]MCI7236611.1 HK97 gp10 family phage protein [Campylobacter sp.]MDY4013749.1 HK97-gp10 family putative phage morphogenesis protein [Campylobacter sp.]MDY4804193.1 HK97-gp10 family putative phage morphogenesis protein [Campylobacter sp.]MDY4830602.1 HK97-gp10 family putative phage morphogenesis protein [Campylobacter sp.]